MHSLRKILIYVIIFHLCFVVWLSISSDSHPVSKKKIVVKTVELKKPDTQMLNQPSKVKSAPRKIEKNIVKAKAIPKQNKTVSTIPEKKPSSKNHISLLKAKESLSNIPKLARVSSDESETKVVEEKADLPTYRENLFQIIQLQLILPEKGDVQVRLTLESTGIIKKIEIVNAESKKNKNYVEQRLPKLSFPPFDKSMNSKNTQTFLLTLTHEED